MEEDKEEKVSEDVKTKKKSQKAIILIPVICIIIAVLAVGGFFIYKQMNDEKVEEKTKKERVVSFNETTNLEDKLEITIVSNKVTKRIDPPSASGYYSFYEAKDGKKYIEIVADVKNLTEKEMNQGDAFSAKVYLEDTEYDCFLTTEEDNGKDLNLYVNGSQIKPLETLRYHVVAELPEEEITDKKNVKVVFTVDEKEYNYQINLVNNEDSEDKGNDSTINLNYQGKEIKAKEKLEIDKICEFTIIKNAIKNKIEPPSASGYYSYYSADNGKVYFDLIADIKNLRESAVKQDEVIGNATLIYDGKYEYDCQLIVEEDNGKDLNGYTNLYDINPLETMRYHIASQVPEELKKSDKKIDIKISIAGEDYIYHVR